MNVEEILIECAALALLASSVILVRHSMLSIRYGLGWIVVSTAGLGAGPVLIALQSTVRRLGFTPTGFSLGVFVVFLMLLSLQLSISLSGLHRAVQDLSEHGALLEQRVAQLEAEAAGDREEVNFEL